MAKIDKVVIKETKYIAFWTLVFSVIMELVFVIIAKWDYTVILGNLLGAGAAVLNFFLMGLGVQKAVTMEVKDAKQLIKISSTLRMVMLIIIAVIGVYVPVFHMWAVLIPLFFPRIAIFIRPFIDKNLGKDEVNNGDK